MKKYLLIAAMALSAVAAHAQSEVMKLVGYQNALLGSKVNLCRSSALAAAAQSNSGTPGDWTGFHSCLADGKDSIKAGHAEIKASLKKKKVPKELADWRLEWMTTFDATNLKPGDTESSYNRRIDEARQITDRATNKLEIALE